MTAILSLMLLVTSPDQPICTPVTKAATACCTMPNGAQCCGTRSSGSGISGCSCG